MGRIAVNDLPVASPDRAIATVGTPNIKIKVLENDTGGTKALKVQSVTQPTGGTVTVDDWIYAGGNFTNIGGQPRHRIARLNSSDGTPDVTFNPNANDFVGAIAIDTNANLIVGGQFTNIGRQPRHRIARLNSIDGTADPTFNPNADNMVEVLAIDPKRSIAYTPNANFNGLDTFSYTATDGYSTSISTVSVLVNNSPVLDNSGTLNLTAINAKETTIRRLLLILRRRAEPVKALLLLLTIIVRSMLQL